MSGKGGLGERGAAGLSNGTDWAILRAESTAGPSRTGLGGYHGWLVEGREKMMCVRLGELFLQPLGGARQLGLAVEPRETVGQGGGGG